MKTNNALLFKRLSSETEEILLENLDMLKGGGNSDGIDLEEVEIVGEPPAEDEEVEEEDPHDDEEPWDEWDEDGGYGTNPDETEEEEEEPSDCQLTYANLPAGNSSNQQILNTCATSVFAVLNCMEYGSNPDIDGVLNEVATMISGQTDGGAFNAAKIDLLQNGISGTVASQYISGKYMEESISTTYANIQESIRDGAPVYSMMNTGLFDGDGTSIYHAVLFTGVTNDGKATYWDPQTDTYHSTDNFSNFNGSNKINISGEKQVECR